MPKAKTQSKRPAPKELYLLRHAIALAREEWPPDQDQDRPLTEEGREKAQAVAKGLRNLGVTIDRIATSPLLRARQTAEIVALVFSHRRRPRVLHELAPGVPVKVLIGRLLGTATLPKSVLVVGHEPDLSRLASTLLTGKADLPLTFKKGGLCKIGLERLAGEWRATLEWLAPPAILRRVKP